jgi:hypothetical protein
VSDRFKQAKYWLTLIRNDLRFQKGPQPFRRSYPLYGVGA